MPRGQRKEIVYTGKAAKLNEKVMSLEVELQVAKNQLKEAYKEQLKAEKEAAKKAKRDAAIAAKKREEENRAKIMKMIKESDKTYEEILALLEDNLK